MATCNAPVLVTHSPPAPSDAFNWSKPGRSAEAGPILKQAIEEVADGATWWKRQPLLSPNLIMLKGTMLNFKWCLEFVLQWSKQEQESAFNSANRLLIQMAIACAMVLFMSCVLFHKQTRHQNNVKSVVVLKYSPISIWFQSGLDPITPFSNSLARDESSWGPC